MAEIDEILQEYIDNNRDVTFPIHYEDRANLPPAFVPFGFSSDGRVFTREWSFNFAVNTRIVAAFTGVLFVHTETGTGNKYIHIRSFAQRPLNRISGLPPWYPIPQYARYGPFTETDIDDIVRDLFTDDNARITFLTGGTEDTVGQRLEENANRVTTVESAYRAQLAEAGTSPTTDPIIVQAVRAIVRGDFISGIPIAAGDVLIQQWPGTDLRFSLHPAQENHEIEESLYYDAHFYFYQWRNKIENYSRYPEILRNQVSAPPLSTGRVIYVAQTTASGFSPLENTLSGAYTSANENDVILILDKGTYSLNRIEKFISIIGFLSGDDERDVRRIDTEEGFFNLEHPEWFHGGAIGRALARNYPTIRNVSTGQRGIHIVYRRGAPRQTGVIYLANMSVSANSLNVVEERSRRDCGGAGILIDGRYYDPSSTDPLGNDFSQVHIHNCAIVFNCQSNFPITGRNPPVSFVGGGIMCYGSSPMISHSLIKGNASYYQGGGIGVFKYGWPTIVHNTISYNTSLGHPTSDLDGGEDPGGNGDGGGIGVFQAYPRHRRIIQDELGLTDLLSGRLRERLPDAWDASELRDAKRKWIHIHNNQIHHNRAEMSGGGVYGTVLALISMFDNKIHDNTATQQDGGGVEVTYGSLLKINGSSQLNNQIVNNQAGRSGGGVYIRSSKAEVKNTFIQNNSVSPSPIFNGGGGIAVLSKPEILTGIDPVYDIILHVIFTHIDKVEMLVKDCNVEGNSGNGGGIYAMKDVNDFFSNPQRSAGVSFGLIAILDVHLRVEVAANIRANIPQDIKASLFTHGSDLPVAVPITYSGPSNSIIELSF